MVNVVSALSIISLVADLAGKAKDIGLSGLNPMPYIEAILHVTGTGVDKVREIIEGTGPDFAKMTPDEIHAYFSPKTIEELEAEARA